MSRRFLTQLERGLFERFRAALVACVVAAISLALSVAAAHATLVLGTVTLTPDPPVPGARVELRIELHDPALVEVEDAIVFIELVGAGGGPVAYSSDRLAEPEAAVYVTSFEAPQAGDYTMRIIDRTFRQEEAIAEVELSVGSERVGALAFVLPPTATGPQNLLSWLAWVIGLPLVAGVIVTVLVMRSGPKGDPSDGEDLPASEADGDDQPASEADGDDQPASEADGDDEGAEAGAEESA